MYLLCMEFIVTSCQSNLQESTLAPIDRCKQTLQPYREFQIRAILSYQLSLGVIAKIWHGCEEYASMEAAQQRMDGS